MNKSSKKFFIQEHLLRMDVNSGGIGNMDIERILISQGFVPILFPCHYQFSFVAKLIRVAHLTKLLFTLPPHSVIVFQAPLYATLHRWFIKIILCLRKSIKVICFITDIDGLKDFDERLLKKEVALFKALKNFIVHNNAMKNWLLSHHPAAKISTLEFFDFLAYVNYSERVRSTAINFAGFLDKSKFITQLCTLNELSFDIYGPTSLTQFDECPNVNYHGVFLPEKMPSMLKGSFGLVWDGDGIAGLEGVFGAYNKYISPHKLSLYLLAGLPVIVHVDSASAELIQMYKIGFTVSSLYEIGSIINHISEEEYEIMHKNCLKLAQKISTGKCLISALNALGLTPSS